MVYVDLPHECAIEFLAAIKAAWSWILVEKDILYFSNILFACILHSTIICFEVIEV